MARPSPRAFALFAWLVSTAAGAATADLQSWTLLALQGDLSSRWALYGELQPRLSREVGGFANLLVRGAVGYRLLPRVSLWAGYAWTPRFGPFRDEQRPFQQLLWEEQIGALFLQNRSRLEERLLGGVDGISLRFRHLARTVIWPVHAARWALAFSNEVFLNFTDRPGGPPAGFDQNRTFVGLNFRLSYEMELEVGYLNNVVRQRPPTEATVVHAIALNLWTTLY